MKECIFCRIVEGDAPARVVYENDETMAFLDVNPLSRGHTLVIPKEHYEGFDDLPEDVGSSLMSSLRRLVPEIEAAVEADGANVGFNDGAAAGQEIGHLHGHVIPRFEGDGGRPIHAVAGRKPKLSDDELDDLADTIEATIESGGA
ncbi:MAG: HIT family protein [Halodesulfurarchaeum sp.]